MLARGRAPAVLILSGALLVLAVAWKTLDSARRFRLQHCPSLDILSWDDNLRLSAALDQESLLRAGDILGAGRALVSSETWPPLRDFLQHLAGALHPEGVSVASSVAISLTFFALLFTSALFMLIRLVGPIRAGPAFLVFAFLVSSGRDFQRYSLTGMLETQGMFFLLWSSYFLFRLYSARERTDAGVAWGCAVSLLGVFFTKYPYGAMLLIALLAAEISLQPRFYLDFALEAWSHHYRGWRAMAVVAFVLAFGILSVTGAMGDSGPFARAWKNVVIFVSFLLLLDAALLFVRRRYLWDQLPGTFRLHMLGFALPMFAWLFSYPVRMKTVLGTQQRIIEGVGSDTFLVNLFTKSFQPPWVFGALCAAAFLVLAADGRSHAAGSAKTIDRERDATADDRTAFHLGLRAVFVFLIVQLLLLDVSTGNRQERHLFHLLPAFVLALLLIVFRARRPWLVPVGGVLVGVVVALTVKTSLAQGGKTSMAPAPTVATVCANPPEAFVAPARSIAADVRPGARYVIINRYHELTAPWPHRALATPVDLLVRLRLRGTRGSARNDNRFQYRTWGAFDRLLVVSASCDEPTRQMTTSRATQVGVTLGAPDERSYRAGGAAFCARDYALPARGISPGLSETDGTR